MTLSRYTHDNTSHDRTAFDWKVPCHWLKRLRQPNLCVVIRAPGSDVSHLHLCRGEFHYSYKACYHKVSCTYHDTMLLIYRYNKCLKHCWCGGGQIITGEQHQWHGPLTRYAILRVAHAPGTPGRFSPPMRISDPDMHHGTCVTHMPWCMPGSLTSGFIWSRWRGKRSRHSRRMRNQQFCVFCKRPMVTDTLASTRRQTIISGMELTTVKPLI